MKKSSLIITVFSILLFFRANSQTAEYFESGKNHTPDDGIQGDFHKSNIGKIVFSKKPTDKDLNTQGVSTTFNVGDYIYGRIYLQTCVANYKVYKNLNPIAKKNEAGGVSLRVYFDNKKDYITIGLKDFSGAQTTITQKGFSLNAEGDQAQYNDEDFINALNALSVGQHTCRLELWGYYAPQTPMGYEEYSTKTSIASGEFIIDKKKGSSVKLGRTFASVEAKMTDTDLESRALKALQEYGKKLGWSETFTAIKITEEDWSIEYNQYTGAIVDRRIICTALAKQLDGSCSIQSFAFIQDYNGNGYQKMVKIEGVVSNSWEQIDCNE